MKEFIEVFFGIIREFVSLPICLIFVIVLQLIKNQLHKRKIRFRDEGNWLWITLIMGIPLALLANGINNFEGFNISRFIIESVGYAGGSTVLFKIIKRINIKKLKQIFINNGEGNA
jgi:hypothetical protein